MSTTFRPVNYGPCSSTCVTGFGSDFGGISIESLVSEKEDKTKEVEHIKKVLTMNRALQTLDYATKEKQTEGQHQRNQQKTTCHRSSPGL